MQLTSTSTFDSSTSSSSSSSSSQERSMDCETADRMQDCPLPPATHFKGKKCHHHRHSPPPPHARHHHSFHPPPHPRHHHHFVELRHSSPPRHPRHHDHHHFVELRHPSPPHSRHERGKLLRVKPPKHSKKKVRKLHHLLMRSCKLPKGGRHGHKRHHMHLPPASEGGFFSIQAGGQHPPGCCLHLHTSIGEDCKRAEEQCPSYEMGYGHPPPNRRRHKRSPMRPLIKSEVVKAVARVSRSMAAPPAEPPIEAGAPPVTTTKPAADEATPSHVAP